jgi:two-component system OmpR family sensor kinase
MMRSLRGRLFVGLAAFILVTGLIASISTFRWAYSETLEGQDAVLVQVGALVAKNRLQASRTVQRNVEAEDQLVVRELRSQSNDASAITLPISASIGDGLQTVGSGANQWRVLIRSRADGSRVAVAQRTTYRDEIALGAALRTVLPFAILVPCLLLVIGGVISYSFRPVAHLASMLNANDHDHLAKLPLEGIPEELQPFIGSINGLLQRIATMLERQRRFIADAAHELRSPITALSVQAQNLDYGELPSESRDRLEVLQTGIRRTGHLLEQLLTQARYDSSKKLNTHVVSFDHVVREVVADLLPYANARSIDLGFERIDRIAVRVGATALSVLVRNVVDNAVRYTPNGGRVDIHLYAVGPKVVFRVTDTGPGIRDADLPRVFEPFYRGQCNQEQGSGLGLSIVHQIATAVSGSVDIENVNNGRGLSVTVLIPSDPLLAEDAVQEPSKA